MDTEHLCKYILVGSRDEKRTNKQDVALFVLRDVSSAGLFSELLGKFNFLSRKEPLCHRADSRIDPFYIFSSS